MMMKGIGPSWYQGRSEEGLDWGWERRTNRKSIGPSIRNVHLGWDCWKISIPDVKVESYALNLASRMKSFSICRIIESVRRQSQREHLIIQFPYEEARTTFIHKQVILCSLIGPSIYIDGDLIKLQVICGRNLHAYNIPNTGGKRTTYCDSLLIIDGNPMPWELEACGHSIRKFTLQFSNYNGDLGDDGQDVMLSTGRQKWCIHCPTLLFLHRL